MRLPVALSRKSVAVLLLLVGFAGLAAAAPTIHPDVVYGHKMGMALTFDVIEAEKPNGAGVLFLVSGGWYSRWFDPQLALERQGSFQQLSDRGFTLFLVRHGSSPLFKVPDAVIDVRKALAYVVKNAGTWGVDPARLGVFGGSAGGHLSLMLGDAAEAQVGSSGTSEARVAAVVAYFPPVDLQAIVGPNDRFPALDFDPELADDISPLLYVSADDPPTLLVHGTADQLVPISNSERMSEALEKAGVATNLVVIEGAGHGFRGESEATATEAMIEWFETYLNSEGRGGKDGETETENQE